MALFSPLDSRYAEHLPALLSEEAWLEAQVEVEAAWLEALSSEGLFKTNLKFADYKKVFAGLTQAEITEFEKTTQHATRALVEALSARLKNAGHAVDAKWVHVGITSFDTVDTASRLRLKQYFEKDFFPKLSEFKKTLKDLSQKYAKTRQAGRTHGQWAVPTVFGLSFAEALSRVESMEKRLKADVADLRGQASGAVGGYQALSLLVKEPLQFEESFLKRIGLKPHYGSTQILPPEDVYMCASTVFAISSVVAKLAEDLRHLARSEIAEVAEGMAPGQVGSSTMPQKRNPWNLEHVCSLYKVLTSRLSLLELDMVSEHQRDLTNSASGRFHIEFFQVAHLMMVRLARVLSRLEVVEANMAKTLKEAGSSVYAEAFYVELSRKGIEDAHSKVREAARSSEKNSSTLLAELQNQKLMDASIKIEEIEATILKGSEKKLAKILAGAGE